LSLHDALPIFKMNIYCVIPTYNEEVFISKTLDSIVSQTLLPKKVVVVNDNSTDGTQNIIDSYTEKYSWISSVYNSSENKHYPGSKVIRAFRSEEHTSELQSRENLVCRLL